MYWISFGIVSLVYLLIDIMILCRRKSISIIRRSPWLLHLSLLGNFIEVISIISMLSYLENIKVNNDKWIGLRDSGIIFGHSLLYLPYILRSYRLYIVFNLEKDWDVNGTPFVGIVHRTGQTWQMKILGVLLILPLVICILLIFVNAIETNISLLDDGNNNTNFIVGFYVFLCFFEQLLLIIFAYKLRNIKDEYRMCNELVWVTVIWFISSISSTFIDSYTEFWLSSCLIRNILLLIGSDIIPIFLSFKKIPFSEGLTIEILNSLEIILENEKTIQYFENFLKNEHESESENSGYSLLCLYKELECTLNRYDTRDSYNYSDIGHSKISAITCIGKVDFNSSPAKLKKSRGQALKILKEKYYKKFLLSRECTQLRKIIHEDEVLTFRIMQTSLVPRSSNWRKLDSDFDNKI
jgi:hypothetical protein